MPVVVKLASDACWREQLADEGERLFWASSPYLPEMIAAGCLVSDQAEGLPQAGPALVLEWFDGTPLDRLLRERGHLELAEVQRLAVDLGWALGDLHGAGHCHGDVKPANVVLRRAKNGWNARLVDLGLADAADTVVPRGGTSRYLPSELKMGQARGDGRARDVFALGVVLTESLLGSDFDPTGVGRDVLERLPVDLARIVGPLLDEAPAARPSARWVAQRAAVVAGQRMDADQAVNNRLRRLKGAYLMVRRPELLRLASSTDPELRVGGKAEEWLAGAIEPLRGLRELRGQEPSSLRVTVTDLDAAGWSRVLGLVVGPSATRWPRPDAGSDAELLQRLCSWCETNELGQLTLSALTGSQAPPKDSVPSSPIELALALGEGSGTEAVLSAGEALVSSGAAPDALVIALGRRLRAAGELGRALSILGQSRHPEAIAELGETARRAGSLAMAERCSTQVEQDSDPRVRVRALATLARMALDRGDAARALECLASAPSAAATLEVRALAELRLGQGGNALRTAQQGRAVASTDEERARLDATLGLIYHREGDAEQSVEAFRSSVDHAVRAGAVLEEATYLTGWSAAAAEAGRLGEALAAAERAVALFGVLGQTQKAAHAALNRVAALAASGQVAETLLAAEHASVLACEATDELCQAYVQLALADVLPRGTAEAKRACRTAWQLLGRLEPEHRLRVAARNLEHGEPTDEGQCDAWVRRDEVSVAARLDWWGARARDATARADVEEAAMIASELVALVGRRAPLAERGRALAAGARLARLAGLGDFARRLQVAAAEDAQLMLRRVPSELAIALRAVGWIEEVRAGDDSTLLPEQVSHVETLVRALGQRENLRSLLDQVLDALVLWTGVERGLLLLRAPGGRLLPRAGRNLLRSDLHGEQLALSHTLAQRALERGEPIVAVDASGELDSVYESVHALKLRSVLAIPLLAHGEGLGVVYLDDRIRRGAFGKKELAWVRVVAAIAAVAIADARDRLFLRRAIRRAERAEQRMGEILAAREAELGEVRVELARRTEARPTRYRYEGIVGESVAMRELLRLVDRVVPSEVPVLIRGESGSGKELIARAIVKNGPRAREPFVTENCGAIPESLLESALFGHVRGAFTGATRTRAGLFEIADRGTLFLDEIAEMSLGMQTKLLRVLEDGDVRPVGSERSRHVDVRLIGATHRNLEAMVKDGAFRQDLFYRLNVVSLDIPPLRERHGDIPLLVRHLLGKYAEGRSVRLAPLALERLVRYPWPGNVRQLENELRRALVLADDVISVQHLSENVRADASPSARAPTSSSLRERVDRLELEMVTSALEQTGGNQTRAAELLGLSRFGLQKKMRRLEVATLPPGRDPEGGLSSGP